MNQPLPHPRGVGRRRPLALCCCLLIGGGGPWALASAWAGTPPPPAQCAADSGALRRSLVELYTSEGCSSCPPADRWLSGLRPARTDGAGAPARPAARAAPVALAFHVDYWGPLGWPDRFAQPAFSARQRTVQQASGARFVYTPQVLVDGRDWRGWPQLPPSATAAAEPARVQLQARRVGVGVGGADGSGGQQVVLQLTPLAGAPARLGLWWALVEDGHRSAVGAGENRGEQLRHDHVVRRWVDQGLFSAATPRSWTLDLPLHGEAGRPQRLVVVATDAATGQPLQVLELGC